MTCLVIIEQKGMTLVELIVTISLYTILMLAISSSVFNLYQSNSYAVAQAGEINNARIGMTEWGSNTKEMTTAEDGTYPVVVMEEHRFGYYSDIDQDSSVEYIEYILSGTTLTRYTYDPSGSPATYNLTTPDSEKTLSLYVQNINQSIPTFLYYDNAGNQLTATSPIIDLRYIKAQIIVNIDPVKSPGSLCSGRVLHHEI